MTADITFEIDDTKSTAENIEALKQKLSDLDAVLGPVLAGFLNQLTREPSGEKVAMLTSLRAELDKPDAESQQ